MVRERVRVLSAPRRPSPLSGRNGETSQRLCGLRRRRGRNSWRNGGATAAAGERVSGASGSPRTVIPSPRLSPADAESNPLFSLSALAHVDKTTLGGGAALARFPYPTNHPTTALDPGRYLRAVRRGDHSAVQRG